MGSGLAIHHERQGRVAVGCLGPWLSFWPESSPKPRRLRGARLGVTGTPPLCITGRLLSGAQPLERFVQLIEDELARVR
jgi:hypothetical protein